jgi:TP901 family phage tail tape measure protein
VTVRKVTVELELKVTNWRSNAKAAGQDMKALRGEVAGMQKSNKAAMMDIERMAGFAGAALAGLAGWAVKAGMDFDKQMSEVQAITGESADGLQTLRKAALDAGQATMYSATQAAEAEANLAKAGLTTADILGGALDGSLALAAAGSLDLAEAADIAAKSMSQFGLKGKDVKHVADLLAGGANATATDVGQLGQALAQGGGAAHAAGMSFEDTVTVLGAMTKAAIVGSDAGTSLKTMLLRLSAPTKEAKGLMEQYGISLYDSNGQAVTAYTLAGQLEGSLKNLTAQRRNEILATIFGSDAQRAANALYEVGEQGLHEMNKQILAQADASKVAAVKTDNLAGDIERLKGSLETLFITSSEGSMGGIRFITQALDHLVNTVTDLPGPIKTAGIVLAGLTGLGLLGVVGWSKYRRALNDALEAMRNAGPNMAKVATGLDRVSKFAGKTALAFGALTVAGAAFSAFHEDLNANIDASTLGLQEWARQGKLAGESARLFGDNAEGLTNAIKTVGGSGFGNVINNIDNFAAHMMLTTGPVDDAKETVEAFDKSLADLVQKGEIQLAGQLVRRMAKETGGSLSEVTATLPGYTAALEIAAKGGGKTADEMKGLNKQLGEQEEKILTVTDAWKELHGTMMDADQTMLDARDAVDDIADTFKDGTKKVQGHSRALEENRLVLERAAEKAATAADAYFTLTGDQAGAKKIMDDFRVQAEKATGATGAAKKEVHGLAVELFKLPAHTTVGVTAKVTLDLRAISRARITARLNSLLLAQGGVINAYAGGGEDHSAQIARGGAMRIWNEPETGGEAYIPLANDRRARATSVLADVNNRFGNPLGGGGGGALSVNITFSGDGAVTRAVAENMRVDVRDKHNGSVQTYLGPRR